MKSTVRVSSKAGRTYRKRKMQCLMMNEIRRASGDEGRAFASTPAMLPCIGFAQASAGDVKIIQHNDAVW